MFSLTEDLVRRIGDYLLGTCKELWVLAAHFHIPEGQDIEDMVEDALRGIGKERCPGCNRWVESGELAEEDMSGLCADCRAFEEGELT